MYASASLLAQLNPTGTASTAAFTAVARTEITRVIACNTTGSAASYDLYHDDAAAGLGVGNAVVSNKSVAANSYETPIEARDGNGLVVAAGGVIGVRNRTGSAITFSIYGVPVAGR